MVRQYIELDDELLEHFGQAANERERTLEEELEIVFFHLVQDFDYLNHLQKKATIRQSGEEWKSSGE